MNTSLNEVTDLRLMARTAEQDKAAFGQLYDRYAGLLFSIAMRVLRNESDAQDVIQEVFVQIWNKAASYDASVGKPLNWFITITRHRSIDRLRASNRRFEYVHELTAALEEESPDPSWSPEVDLSERSIVVRTALQVLPAEQREAIEMAFFGGLTHEQIASRVHQPLGTIKARIRRGMLKLRGSLEARL